MRKGPALLVLLAALAAALGGCREERPAAPPLNTGDWLVGAYYYTWYPRNFHQGTLRAKLVPPQEPELGLYASEDPVTVERHIAQAAGAGIDFLAVGFWPTRAAQNKVLPRAFLKAKNLGDIRFCIFYETWSLGFDSVRGMTVFTPEKSERFVRDMVSFGEKYFGHPSYLKVGGRPVVFLYLTRTLAGDYAAAIRTAREKLRAQGHDVFFVADEVFWNAAPADATATSQPVLVERPQLERVRLFDAVTSYNMYEGLMEGHRGYGAQSAFVGDVARRYEEFIAAAGPSVYFVPDVLPGYNDRGVRPRVDHFPIPRRWSPEADDASFFREMWRRIGVRFADPRLNMVMITSWNEWNEDTGIEPLKPAPPAPRDQSPTGDYFTRGYAYPGHGEVYLDALRKLTAEKPPGARAGAGRGD